MAYISEMYLWRISKYADLSGRGGVSIEGRWHRKGTPIVYCSDHPSTALLEVLVHLQPQQIPPSFQLIKIKCPDHVSILNKIDREPEPNNAEQQVWESVAIGTSIDVLGKMLGLSPKTVDAYLNSIREKVPEGRDFPTAIADLMQRPVEDQELSQTIGMKWIESNKFCLLRVPSFVMPAASNYLINPRHLEAADIEVEETTLYPFDSRLLS
jgi:RES domain-containing protein